MIVGKVTFSQPGSTLGREIGIRAQNGLGLPAYRILSARVGRGTGHGPPRAFHAGTVATAARDRRLRLASMRSDRDLTSSTRQKAGDFSRGSHRAVSSRFTGRAAPSPPRAATACPAAVPCQVVHMPAWLSQTCSIISSSEGRERRFLPGLQAGVFTPRS